MYIVGNVFFNTIINRIIFIRLKKSIFEHKHKTSGVVRSRVYWPDAKITSLGPAVQAKTSALK